MLFIIDPDPNQAELDDLLNKILPVDQYGPAIHARVAETLVSLQKREIQKEEMEKLWLDYKPPDNARLLGVPRIRPELWNGLPSKARSSDAKLQVLQQKISQALIGTAHVIHLMYTAGEKIPKEEKREITKKTLDIAKNLTVSWKEVSSQRRVAICNYLRQDLAHVASNAEPSIWLFGDNLQQNIQLAQAAAKMVRPINNNRYQPYPNNRGRGNLNYRGRGRGRGGGQNQGKNFHNQNKPFNGNNPNSHNNNQQQAQRNN